MTASWCDLYADIVLAPEWTEWSALIDANRARPATPLAGLQPATVETLRKRLICAAQGFVTELEALAGQRDIALPSPKRQFIDASNIAPDAPLTLTGHQPTVFHPGLVFKYEATQQLAREQQGPAISILMDTDQGDAGQFAVPLPANSLTARTDWCVEAVRVETLSRHADLFLGHRVLSSSDVVQRSERVVTDLRACQRADAAASAHAAMKIYQKLADCPAVHANSIVRRAMGLAVDLLELPLSTLCRQPEIQQFFGRIALDGINFHRAYNRTLDVWRETRKLRNPANPFPNLDRQESLYELPFWWVDLESKTRHAVWLRTTTGGAQLHANGRLVAELVDDNADSALPMNADCLFVPRGALITIVFRLLCSDLFVHGLGGQSYDQYTDAFIRDYFAVDPPAYAVASASRYLFDDQRLRLGRLDELAARQREMAHHPGDYVGAGWFSESSEQQLVPLLAHKEQLVATLRANKQAGVSAAAEGRQLQQLQDRIKTLVAADFADRLAQRTRLADATRSAVESRTYPWFFFGWELTTS